MKKIAKPSRHNRLIGRAEKDGVAFQAAKITWPFGISHSITLATAHENGDIECQTLDFKEVSFLIDDKIRKISKIALWTSISLSIVFFILSCWLVFYETHLYQLFFSLSYAMISAALLNQGIAIFFARIFGNAQMKSFSKFLAAAHATENAYYDLGRVPTIDEVKDYSTYLPYCKYLKNLYLATYILAIGLLRFIPGIWYIIISILTMCLLFYLEKKGILFFWQFLVVSKPKDIHYQTALIALEESARWLDSVELHVSSFKIPQGFRISDFSEEKCKECDFYDLCKQLSVSDEENKLPSGS